MLDPNCCKPHSHLDPTDRLGLNLVPEQDLPKRGSKEMPKTYILLRRTCDLESIHGNSHFPKSFDALTILNSYYTCALFIPFFLT